MEQSRGRRGDDIEGVYFALSELEILRDVGFPGVQLEIVATRPSYEEVIVFRRTGSPSPVLGTLHKSPEGFFMLTREDPDHTLVAPSVRRAYLTLEDVLASLSFILSRRRERSR